jgi:hypothetical protein
MLNRKNLLLLAAVLVVLIVVSVLQDRSHEASTSRPSSQVLVEGEWSRDDLSRIVLSHAGEDAVTLTSGPETWLVGSAWNSRANGQRIDTLLRSLGDLRGEFRSDEPAVVADYGFGDSTSVVITGFGTDGDEVFAVEIGGQPQGGRGNFVKLPGSSEVYLTQTNLLSNLGLWSGPDRPTSRHFLDLQALRVESRDVDAVTLATADGTLRLVKEFAMVEPAPDDTVRTEPFADRETWEWRLEDGDGRELGMAVKTKADALLGAATNVRAQDVADPGADAGSYGLSEPGRTATLEMSDGSTHVLRFGDEREAADAAPGGFFARFDDEPTVWVVGTFAADNVFKDATELLPEE